MFLQIGQLVDPRGVDELIDATRVTPWDFVWAALLLVGGLAAGRLVTFWIRRTLSNRTAIPIGTVNLLAKVSGWIVVLVAVVFALPLLGVDVTPMVILLVLLVAVTVVSGRVLMENYGAGIVLQAEGRFGPGDQIVTSEHTGAVVEVSSRTVLLETIDGRRVVVPNTSVLGGALEVLTAHPQRRSELVVGLAYGSDLDAARRVLTEATQQADGVAADPPVQAYATGFGDSTIDFVIWFWHASDVQSTVAATSTAILAVDRACKAHDLTIAFPQRTLWWGEPPPNPQSS